MTFRNWTAKAALLVCACASLQAQVKTTAGAFTVERPTLVSLGFEWRIQGDANGNAKVAVHYRKVGEQQWHDALPMLRLNNVVVQGTVYADRVPEANHVQTDAEKADYDAAAASVKYVSPNMFAGSILNLQPGTAYECKFTLTDSDGVAGVAERTVTVKTRSEPMPAACGHVYHVYPIGWTGPRKEPWFTGLLAAYYLRAPHIDWENAYAPRVQPGDTILIHAGIYLSDRSHYMNKPPQPGYNALGTLFDGTYYLTASGTAEKPIVMKSAGDGEVIFDGDGTQTLFNLMGGSYNYFEGITVRNTNVAFLLGIKDIAGSSGFTLKHSRIYDVGRAVQDDWSGSKDFYIADNIFIGRHDPDRMLGWTGGFWAKYPRFPETMASEYAIKIYGQGHVVAYNYVANWHDGIDIATYGTPDGTPQEAADRVPAAIDFYGNDFYNMGDNCMESDGGAHNIRLFANRCFNSTGGALSAQPMWGGPLYLFSNLIYNSPTVGTCKYAPASGVLTYQNTFIGECKAGPAGMMEFKNNLMLAQGSMSSASLPVPVGAVLSVATYSQETMSDYNGFRPNPGASNAFEWGYLKDQAAATSITRAPYRSLADYSRATGQDTHSVLIDFGDFVHAGRPDDPNGQRLYKPEEINFHLRPGSAAIGAGTILPTINDRYTGKAPDLGAYQTGAPEPHYGPRTPAPGSFPEAQSKLRSWTGPQQ